MDAAKKEEKFLFDEDYFDSSRKTLKSIEENPIEILTGFSDDLMKIQMGTKDSDFSYFNKYIEDSLLVIQCLRELIKQKLLLKEDYQVFLFAFPEYFSRSTYYLIKLQDGVPDSEELMNSKVEPLQMLLALTELRTIQKDPPSSNAEEPENEKSESKSDSDESEQEVSQSEESQQYLLCENDERFFAICIKHIVEVIKSRKILKLPFEQNKLVGLLNLRSQTLPILNINETLRNKRLVLNEDNSKDDAEIENENENVKRRYVIVSNIKDRVFGFEVDKVNEVISLNRNSFQDFDEAGNESLVKQISLTNEKIILIIDLTKAFAASNLT